MGSHIMLGINEKQCRFMYELVKKELDSLDIVLDKMKGCSDLEWLKNRYELAEDVLDLLSIVFCP